jgi:hypothetical protein
MNVSGRIRLTAQQHRELWGAVEGWGIFKRYRTSAGQGSIWYPPVAGVAWWYRSTCATAIDAVIIDIGARSYFARSLERIVHTEDSGGFGPRTLDGQPGSNAPRRSSSVSSSSGGSPRLGERSAAEDLCIGPEPRTAADRSK